MAVFEFDTGALDPHHGADETGLRILHHHPGVRGLLHGSDLARPVRVVGEHVVAVTVSHRGSVGGGTGVDGEATP